MGDIQGKLIILNISTDGGTTKKVLICLEDLSVNRSSATSKRETRCGVRVGISPQETTISGTFVWDDSPTGSQVSGLDMQGWSQGNTLLYVEAAHETTPAEYFIAGNAYLTEFSDSAPTNDVLSSTFTFDFTGTPDIVP
jgi:hypothetical protein